MYDSFMIWLVPVIILAGALAGWLGAWNEVRLAGKSEPRQKVSCYFVRTRAMTYGLALYVIFATLAFCGGGLCASAHWHSVLAARGTLSFLLPGSLQTLVTGGMSMLFSGTVSLEALARKHGADVW